MTCRQHKSSIEVTLQSVIMSSLIAYDWPDTATTQINSAKEPL